MVGGVYKIVAEVLANRLKMVVERIISKPQNALTRGRLLSLPMSALIIGLDLGS